MQMWKPILLVEDNANDRELITIALNRCRLVNPIVCVADGEEALDYLFKKGVWQENQDESPVFVLLDKKLPKVDGHEVLAVIRSNEATEHLPVLMLTSSRHEKDLLVSYELGVNAYIVKPIQHQEFMEAVMDIGVSWAVHSEPRSYRTREPGEKMIIKSIDAKTGSLKTEIIGD